MKKRHINEFQKTVFANCGRAAGIGIFEDSYGDEDGLKTHHKKYSPFEHIQKGEDGEVVVYKGSQEVSK